MNKPESEFTPIFFLIMDLLKRKEYKYFADYELLEPLQERFLANMVHDPHCRTAEDKRYTVRSIYLDTRDLRFYYEKKDGLKIRKKLRIRTYGSNGEDNTGFLEIKRKNRSTIMKERVKIRLAEAESVLNGAEILPLNDNPRYDEKLALDRFIYLTKRLKLVPQTLVAYEREALQALDDSRLRVTFDLNVRSYPQPDMSDFFREKDLVLLEQSHFILEIKFNGKMPIWVRHIVRDFRLHVQAISKYCNGIDRWYKGMPVQGSLV